ncbi:MAG: hypothetical protein ABFS30_05900 [Pseudomonadota bacterium]
MYVGSIPARTSNFSDFASAKTPQDRKEGFATPTGFVITAPLAGRRWNIKGA